MNCEKRNCQHRARNFYAKRRQRQRVNLLQLAFHELAYRAEAGAARALYQPGKQDEPGHLAQHRRRGSEPQSGDWKPGYCRRAEIMDELNVAIEEVLQLHARLLHRHHDVGLRPSRGMFLLTGLTQTLRSPGFNGPSLKLPLSLCIIAASSPSTKRCT